MVCDLCVFIVLHGAGEPLLVEGSSSTSSIKSKPWEFNICGDKQNAPYGLKRREGSHWNICFPKVLTQYEKKENGACAFPP